MGSKPPGEVLLQRLASCISGFQLFLTSQSHPALLGRVLSRRPVPPTPQSGVCGQREARKQLLWVPGVIDWCRRLVEQEPLGVQGGGVATGTSCHRPMGVVRCASQA